MASQISEKRKLELQKLLTKARLINNIKRLQVKGLKYKGKLFLKPIVPAPFLKRPLTTRYFSDNRVHNDVESAFNADIGHGDSALWGGEKYFHDNDYYSEDYFGNEDTFDVGINFNRRGSPLFF